MEPEVQTVEAVELEEVTEEPPDFLEETEETEQELMMMMHNLDMKRTTDLDFGNPWLDEELF